MKIGADLDRTLARHEQDVKGDDLSTYKHDCLNADPSDSMKKLLSLGDEVIIITARPQQLRQVTELWLNKHNIKWDSLYLFPSESLDQWKEEVSRLERSTYKAEVLKREEPDLFIDDSTGIRVIKEEAELDNTVFLQVI